MIIFKILEYKDNEISVLLQKKKGSVFGGLFGNK